MIRPDASIFEKRIHCQRGQAMIEYVVVCSVLALLIGLGMIDQNSVLWQLIDSFQNAYRNYSFAISLPT